MKKISAVYQIINTVTNDRYIGSSKNAGFEHPAIEAKKYLLS